MTRTRNIKSYPNTIRIFTVFNEDIRVGADAENIATDGNLPIQAIIIGDNNRGINQGLLIIRGYMKIGVSNIRLASLGGGVGYTNYYLQRSIRPTDDSKVMVIFEREYGLENYYTGVPNGWNCLTCSFESEAGNDITSPTVCSNCGAEMGHNSGPRTRFSELPGKILASCHNSGDGKSGNIAMLLPIDEPVCVTSQNIIDGSVVRRFYVWDGKKLALTNKQEIID